MSGKVDGNIRCIGALMRTGEIEDSNNLRDEFGLLKPGEKIITHWGIEYFSEHYVKWLEDKLLKKD